jgi:MFS transporter, DHA2 family, multidrug resistance protein
MRNIGSAIGISIIQAIHVDTTQAAHSRLVEHLRPDNPNVIAATGQGLDLSTTLGQAMASGMAERQSAMIAYVHDFSIMLLVAMLIAPMLLLVRKPKKAEPILNAAAE